MTKLLFDLRWTLMAFFRERHATNAAALAYYGLFSLPAMCVLAMGIAQLVVQQAQARDYLLQVLKQFLGAQTAPLLADTMNDLQSAARPQWATGVSVLALVFSASSVFSTLQRVLNSIFGVTPHRSGKHALLMCLRRRVLAIALVLLLGASVLLTIAMETVLSLASSWLQRRFPLMEHELPWLGSSFMTIAAVMLLCTLFFKVLPDTSIGWKSCAQGAGLTAILMVIIKQPVGLYLRSVHPESVYHAAGGVIVMMVWMFFAAAVFLFGALFAHRADQGRKDHDRASPVG